MKRSSAARVGFTSRRLGEERGRVTPRGYAREDGPDRPRAGAAPSQAGVNLCPSHEELPGPALRGVSGAVPRVSVAVATHRRPDLLREALASVAAQTFRDLETTVAEDGGTEETARDVAALETAPETGLVFGPAARFGVRCGVWPRRVPARVGLPRLLRGNCAPLSAVLARREALGLRLRALLPSPPRSA